MFLMTFFTMLLTPQAVPVWEQILDFIKRQGFSFAVNFLAALAIFVFGRWAVKLLIRWMK